jgi:hypothetical protein
MLNHFKTFISFLRTGGSDQYIPLWTSAPQSRILNTRNYPFVFRFPNSSNYPFCSVRDFQLAAPTDPQVCNGNLISHMTLVWLVGIFQDVAQLWADIFRKYVKMAHWPVPEGLSEPKDHKISIDTEDGSSMFLRNVGIYLRAHTTLLPSRTVIPVIAMSTWSSYVLAHGINTRLCETHSTP